MGVNDSRVMLALMKGFYPHGQQNGSHTDVIVHETLTPLVCCKSMLLGYLLQHRVQIYTIGKWPYYLLCVGPLQGDQSQQPLIGTSTGQVNDCEQNDLNLCCSHMLTQDG